MLINNSRYVSKNSQNYQIRKNAIVHERFNILTNYRCQNSFRSKFRKQEQTASGNTRPQLLLTYHVTPPLMLSYPIFLENRHPKLIGSIDDAPGDQCTSKVDLNTIVEGSNLVVAFLQYRLEGEGMEPGGRWKFESGSVE